MKHEAVSNLDTYKDTTILVVFEVDNQKNIKK